MRRNILKPVLLFGSIAVIVAATFWGWFEKGVYDVYVFPNNAEPAPEYFRGRYATESKARREARATLRKYPGDWDYMIGKTSKGEIGSKVTYQKADYSEVMK